jgi:hypothetical protein
MSFGAAIPRFAIRHANGNQARSVAATFLLKYLLKNLVYPEAIKH